MATVNFPILSPIRFYDPSLEFDNETTFQNPDNRLSTSYDWENVNEVPYALPIPKVWPDGQPGIDFVINTLDTSPSETVYAHLYDSDDVYYKALYVDAWDDKMEDYVMCNYFAVRGDYMKTLFSIYGMCNYFAVRGD